MHPVLAINKASGRWPVAVKASIAVAGPLLVATLLGEPRYGLMTGLGAFAVLYGPYTAGRFRARLVASVAAGLTAATALGVLTHASPVLNLLVLAVIGVVAAITMGALKVGPPGAYFMVLVAGIASFATTHGQSPWLTVLMTATGGAVAVVVSLLDLLWAPRGAEVKALAGAEKAVTGFEQSDRPGLNQARALASQSLHHAWTTVTDGTIGDPSATARDLQARMVDLQARYERRSAMISGAVAGFEVHPWGSSEGEEGTDDSRFAVFQADISTEQLRESSLGRPHGSYLMRRALSWPSERMLIGARVAIAALVAGGIALAFTVNHPYWAVSFAVLVLHQGGTRAAQTVRGVQRLLGTVLGLGFYVLVLWWNPQGLWLVLMIAGLQFCIELLVVRNYALAVAFITPLALTIAHASAPAGDPRAVVLERGLDTMLAIAVALSVLWLVGRRTPLLLARAQARAVIEGLAPVLAAISDDRMATPGSAEQRRHLYYELLELEHFVNQSMTDDPVRVEPYKPMFTAVAELGYTVLGACWHPEGHRAGAAATRASQGLEQLTKHPVTQPRSAEDLMADVQAVRAELRHWE
ncbi:FUSC family protein [Propionibacteriaceae bacterium G57]|uniref:FUSC family protein n=1 Tax=Aestuariimicrobium sp. G57 TaxID=3418485 RepID=UPI003DA7A03D